MNDNTPGIIKNNLSITPTTSEPTTAQEQYSKSLGTNKDEKIDTTDRWVLKEEEFKACISQCMLSVLTDSRNLNIIDCTNMSQPFVSVPKTKKIFSRLKNEIFQTSSCGILTTEYIIGRGTFGYAILATNVENEMFVLKVDHTKVHAEWEACIHKIVRYLIIFRLPELMMIVDASPNQLFL